MIPFAFSLEKPLCENNNTLLNVSPPFYMLIKLRVREFVPYVLRASTRPLKLSSTLDIPMEQLITLTVEKPQMHGGKPTDRTYLEKNLPASLDKALREYIQGEKDKVSYMDCLWGELYSAINSNQWSNAITQEQADYLREKYL